MSKEQAIIKEKISNEAIELIFKKGSKTTFKSDLLKALDYAMEQYAQTKVLEALEELEELDKWIVPEMTYGMVDGNRLKDKIKELRNRSKAKV